MNKYTTWNGKLVYFGRCAGFGLSELLIVIAIVGILAMFAVPSYVDTVKEGKRDAGKAFLLSVMQTQERYRSENMTYAGSMQELLEDGSGSNWRTMEEGYYQIRVMNTSAAACRLTDDCIRLRLRPVASASMAGDSEYRLWSNGRKQRRVNGSWVNNWD